MVRETRHLWVGNLPENIREDRIREHFKRYGRVQSVKLLPARSTKEEASGETTMACCTVAFMDIKSASKAHTAEHKIDDRTLTTEYYEPAAIPSSNSNNSASSTSLSSSAAASATNAAAVAAAAAAAAAATATVAVTTIASPGGSSSIVTAVHQNNIGSTYSSTSTSPGNGRFSNSHGSVDEHTNFPSDRFYDRSNSSRLTEPDYIRRSSGAVYHDSRGRNRERVYRNGPPFGGTASVIERRTLSSTWPSYDTASTTLATGTTSRYNCETGYGTPESTDRRSTDSQKSTKKKEKSRSGSGSPSPSGSTSSRTPSRSRSRSSSCSTTSSTSRDTSSTGSPKSRRVSSVVNADDKRPLAICVKNLPQRSSDTSLKDGLFHEYKKHGKVTWVKIVGTGPDRYGIVCFKKPEDVEKALEVSYDKLFFGCKIEVAAYQGFDIDENELRYYEADVDEYHPKATRTLFVGNLEKEITASDLRKHFDQFGEIIEIDIKKQGAVSSYAFCQYSDIASVVKAIRALDGEHLGNNRVKLGFGKSMPTSCVWVDGVADNVTEKFLTVQFDTYGAVTQVVIDRDRGQALVFYEQVMSAQNAVAKMRGVSVRGRKIQVDFASRECQEAFYEHLEKHGHPASVVDERRDSSSRSFESSTLSSASARFVRYDSSSRPRTSSYSSRSSVTGNPCSNVVPAIASPGTPGSVTPRGSGSRSRLARYADYYDQGIGDYIDRSRYRSYDEYSQGSAASHDDPYDHEYATYVRDSPSHLDGLDTRLSQHADIGSIFPQAPPDIRNLQKERVHLLEQLEDCHSSGDELISPRKRLKLDSDVIIETNRDHHHRKVMEVRRTSDASGKHHSRRPSIDNGGKHTFREVTTGYVPHAVCKRRKTAGSDSSSARLHHHDLSGSESVGSSRPGTPLCDERPEHFPSEPRRATPREREGPLSLPLPRFAAQIMGKGSVSVAGIKGQKEATNVLASPPPAATSPRIITNAVPAVPPPASPPPRPPSLSSNTSDSDVAPPSPSLDERIRSLDEKYEKWSGSRALSAAGGDALAKLDATASERFRFRHKLLDLDLKEVQPSEIVKSVMAKRSVFDEDSKRLENVGEKYEPREFSLFVRTTTTSAITSVTISSTSSVMQNTVPATPLPATTHMKVPSSTPTMLLSPRAAGTSLTSSLTAVKGLQYPFPTHPPIQQPVIVSTSSPVVSSSCVSTVTATTVPLRSTNHQSDVKVKLSASGSTSVTTQLATKVTLNRSVTINSSSSVTPAKSSDNTPLAMNLNDNGGVASQMRNDNKSGDKITSRRDSSTSNSSSPRNRRNSENSLRKQNSDKNSDNCDNNSGLSDCRIKDDRNEESSKEQQHRIEKEYLEKEKQEKERLEKEKLERERLEKERLENLERERLEKERLERERVEKERAEKERQDHVEKERRRSREERERREKEELEKRNREGQERLEQEKRDEREKREKEENERFLKDQEERIEKENTEREHLQRKREEERKQDNHHEKRSRDHVRYAKEIFCNDTKHKETTSDVSKSDKNTKESSRSKENQEHSRKDTFCDNKRDDFKSKHNIDRDVERRKENTKENKDNNLHDKTSHIVNENHKENHKHLIESRHFSIDVGKIQFDVHRKKDKNNAQENMGFKRRMSFQETLENVEEAKKLKLSHEQNKKLPERRDSKDSRLDEKTKNKHKNNISKLIEDKIRHEKHNSVGEDKRKDKEQRDKEEKHKHKQLKIEKQKSKEKNRDKDTLILSQKSNKEPLYKNESKSADELDKYKQKKELKEKRKQECTDTDEQKMEEFKKSDDRRKEKRLSLEGKSKDESCNKSDERRAQKKEKSRKNNSSDGATDSDEPKRQHSIFDIVDDEPAYISMYDKVKARSCKNMQKQEEEKRQEKLKAKFNQLKQSRAKREEKKRSTSWDEDTDSEHEKQERPSKNDKSRRSSKMFILSSDDDEHGVKIKSRKKGDSIVGSDVDKGRQIKLDSFETSDEDVTKSRSYQHKTIKSRIASDSSDNDYKKIETKIMVEPKTELFSDTEFDTKSFMELEDSKLFKKSEVLKYNLKKEKKGKHHDMLESEQIKIEVFGESPVHEIKSENKYDDSRTFGDVSSEESHHKKEKNELRKKHKKKQKRQKHSFSSEESSRMEDLPIIANREESVEKFKPIEKKKPHKMKDKKRDKLKHDEKHKDKTKRTKKIKPELGKSEPKDKIENIFGSFSEDSEHGQREQEQQIDNLQKSLLDNCFGNDESHARSVYMSDSDDNIPLPEKESSKLEEKERNKEHKRKKEKKRREREKRQNEEETNENSMDYADLGRQLEDNIKDDNINEFEQNEGTAVDFENKTESNTKVFNFIESHESDGVVKDEDKREQREKKKKRKKSKEEKHKHHHHHHKDKIKSPEIKKEAAEIPKKSQIEKPTLQSPSLPNIISLESPPHLKPISETDFSVSSKSTDSTGSTKSSSSKEKTRDKLIPCFGNEIDETIHENAVKSISEFEPPKNKKAVALNEEETKSDKSDVTEDKPRVVISQEETEDAVAALLGESFGGNSFNNSYTEDQTNLESSEQETAVAEENSAEDLEEMRQAVQSLNNSTDMEIKPDTPQSEHELQIDTDTEEQEEVGLRLDQLPATPDMMDLNHPPKTPDVPSYCRPEEQSKATIVIKTTNLGSPPSLTPIKPNPSAAEVKRITEDASDVPVTSSSPALAVVSEVPLLTQKTTSTEIKKEVPDLKSTGKGDERSLLLRPSSVNLLHAVVPPTKPPAQPRSYSTPPMVKITEPVIRQITISPKTDSTSPTSGTEIITKVQTIPVLQPIKTNNASISHSIPLKIQFPVTQNQPKHSPSTTSSTGLLSPKVSSTVTFSRLPITPVMVSKPFQPTTMYLPQSLTAQTGELKKTTSPVISFERNQERPYQNPQFAHASHPSTQMVIQANVTLQRNLPSHGLLVPAKSLPSGNYSYVQTLTSTSYNAQSISSKDSATNTCDKSKPLTISVTEPPKLVPTNHPASFVQSPVSSSLGTVQTSSALHTSPSTQSAISPKDVNKTFAKVIQESPKLHSPDTEKVTSPVSVPAIQNVVKGTETPVITTNTSLEKKPEVALSSKEISKTLDIEESTAPDSTGKAQIETKIEDMELCSPLIREEPEKEPLAIAKVTEELNKSLLNEAESKSTDECSNEKKKIDQSEPDLQNNSSVNEKTDKDLPVDDKSVAIDSLPKETPSSKESPSEIKVEEESVNQNNSEPAGTKEDSDYWSAKEVNIDSVIKKVDALCSGDDVGEKKPEVTNEESKSEKTIDPQQTLELPTDKIKEDDFKHENEVDSLITAENECLNLKEGEVSEEKEISTRCSRRGGGRAIRGRKTRGTDRPGVQTRRSKTAKETGVTAKRGGRGGRAKVERKTSKSESETNDIYEFRDDSDESGVNKDRPRLILTIKSPAVTGIGNAQTAVLKEVPKDTVTPPKSSETKDFTLPPATNTRKSRRLQERDVSRSTVDDTIEDVVKNTMITRSATTASGTPQTRRSTRQTGVKVMPETPRKSPRGSVRKKDRRSSETTDDSSEEKSVNKSESPQKDENDTIHIKSPVCHTEDTKSAEEKTEIVKERPHEGLKAAVLRRVKGEAEKQEPMTLIDPVTGLLMPVRECEEGRYIPVSGNGSQMQKISSEIQADVATLESSPTVLQQAPTSQSVKTNLSKSLEIHVSTPSVITSSSPSVPQPKLQSLKAHVLSSQAARAVVNQTSKPPLNTQVQKLNTTIAQQQPHSQIPQQAFAIRASAPINQNLTVNVTTCNLVPAHLSPRTSLLPGVVKTVQSKPPLSPTHILVHNNSAKQQLMQKVVGKQIQIPPKAHIPPGSSVVVTQIINPGAPPHLKQQQTQMIKQQQQIVLGGKPSINKMPIMSGPQLKEAHLANQQALAGIGGTRLVPASASIPIASAKGNMEPPKVEVSIGGCVMVSRPSSSPQGQTRHVLQTGLPVPPYEASLGEAMAHFPPGTMPLRPPHEIPPAHYMHPHVMYQQFLRHLPRSPMMPGGLEKATDGQEGEEAPVTSPPLELRRPGSVGLSLSGRSATVPHSLQSPHDRTTDSPQMGQVYNVHTPRMQQHYHTGRYYETGEPPPAHRPLTSHSSFAGLGTDRSVSHVNSLGSTPDQRTSLMPSDRLSHTNITTSHLGGLGVPERSPFTAQGLLGAGLGAAGNLIGAVARHVGAEAPASQRGLQAATPPHASQVPPQAESLLMLLKQYPCMWQGLLALKNDQAAVQMYFVSGNEQVAKCSLPKNIDGSTPPLRIFQRMRLEPPQVEGVARKMQMENEHCMLLALPCGHDHMDVLKQSTNLTNGFITYLQQKQAAGIVNVAAPGTTQPPAYVVHIFPSCDFVNENLRRIAPSLLERVADIAHLLIVITTV